MYTCSLCVYIVCVGADDVEVVTQPTDDWEDSGDICDEDNKLSDMKRFKCCSAVSSGAMEFKEFGILEPG